MRVHAGPEGLWHAVCPHPWMPTTDWADYDWHGLDRALDASAGLALLPIGATEQHGRHLPLGVDSMSVAAVTRAAGERSRVPVLPTLPYGCSQGHSRNWPGTISLRPATLSRVVVEIADWAHSAGVTGLLITNGHYTNAAPLRCALEDIRVDLPDLRIGIRSLWELSPRVHALYHADGANWHANAAETGLMAYLHPDLVTMDRAVDEPDRSDGCVFSYRVDQETPTGVVGRASEGRPEEGARLFAWMVEDLCLLIDRARSEEAPLAGDPTPAGAS